jgi:FAD/FMN-containing dehydrogenase
MDPAKSAECIAWARNTYQAMEPYMASGRYVNYLGEDEGTDATAAAYGENVARLREVKTKYDPENVFRLNQNIAPMAVS